MPAPDYQQRIQKLQAIFKDSGSDALLIEDETNLYYLTGMELSAGKLLVHAQGAHLFVDNRYFELCRKLSPIQVILDDQIAKIFERSDFFHQNPGF